MFSVKKWKEKNTATIKIRSGGRKWISEKHVRTLLRTVNAKPQTTTKDLQEHLAGMEMQVHRATVQRTLQQNGLHSRITRKKLFRRPQHKRNLLKYAKEHTYP